ncbi:Lycopene beta-cyclase [Patellaria atrata CBS 101060]|uniref:Bifunctional lycopene cyclase/phytoene synthase n=1 Tax=Patellaria atrata CBS 101060 TaxID=1346257 RepID=A0A9P4SC38_9PEZI|nr:Lycopene beta-cyclase [Patellaria atrata CBS 101060]
MGYEYALVHLKFTIPPAIILSVLYRPLVTAADIYKIVFLVTVAVVSTIPWDSYLIRNRIWSYPSNVIIGPTLFQIPLEEVFFFMIQTYNTSLLYLLLSKPTFHSAYILSVSRQKARAYRTAGQLLLALVIAKGVYYIRDAKEKTYLGLILAWAGPVLLFLWTIAYQFLVGLPWTNTILPIILPTVYLWIVDTLALRRGTWVIEAGTKFGWQLWDGLEIEEAAFFLATNTLIVFGLIAFDNALAILYAFPTLFPNVPPLPSPAQLTLGLLTPSDKYDEERVRGLKDAVARLRGKSRSFYLASGAFYGRLRIDLILVYSFCRVADDLVDHAQAPQEARDWIMKLQKFMDIAYEPSKHSQSVREYVMDTFSADIRLALLLLPTSYLPRKPFDELLEGFWMDLQFEGLKSDTQFPDSELAPPIKSEQELEIYASRVAGTVAELCIELAFHHHCNNSTADDRSAIVKHGHQVGIALQYVNIARDISVDASIGRVYMPLTWLSEENLTVEDVLKSPKGPVVDGLRSRLLDKAFELYNGGRVAIEDLPDPVRGPMRVAVESYMEIGRVLRQKEYQVKSGRATVPKKRRIWVAWKTLNRL